MNLFLEIPNLRDSCILYYGVSCPLSISAFCSHLSETSIRFV